MFEFDDEKLGPVKVVNVTEARSSMASLMGDGDFNYIITKNNKPVRVVVSYETFKKAMAPGANPPGVSSSGVSRSANKVPEFKDSLKGLIQSKERDLKEREAIVAAASVVAEVQETALEETVPQEGAEESTFPAIDLEETGTNDNQGGVSPPSYVTVSTPPPNSDYFNRFKKLYETPRHDSLFQAKNSSPNTSIKATGSSEPVVTHQPIPSPPTPNRRPHANSDLPSIQDLLSELEQEKLIGEEEDGLNSNQVNQLLNRINK